MDPARYLRSIVRNHDRFLSLCSGIGLELYKLPAGMDVTAVDIVPEYLSEFKKKYPWAETHVSDVVSYISKVEEGSFDVISIMDGLEHLAKTQGLKLIKTCKRVTTDKVVVFTPEGYVKNEPKHTWGIKGGDKYQRHLSGWEVPELEELGFKLVYQNPSVTQHGEKFNESMYVYTKTT